MQQAEEPQASGSWDTWLAASVAQLRQHSLFRTLRPTVPGLSAVEVRAWERFCSTGCRLLWSLPNVVHQAPSAELFGAGASHAKLPAVLSHHCPPFTLSSACRRSPTGGHVPG